MVRFLLPLLLLFATPALALESAPVVSARDRVTLVSDTDQVSPGAPYRIGLRFRLQPGWHVYWKNPGDAGLAPSLDLTLPEGSRASDIIWPAPTRLTEGPVTVFGYEGDVVLPVVVTPGGGAQNLTASAEWLVCGTICVPEQGRFTLDLPSGEASPSAAAPLFAAAAARTPAPAPFAARIAPDGTLTLAGLRDAEAVTFFPDQPGLLRAGVAPRPEPRGGDTVLALKPDTSFKPGAAIAGVVAVEKPGQPTAFYTIDATPAAAPPAALGLPEAMLFALLGGLILNLMPCVFPILAMKAMAVAKLSAQARGAMRRAAWAYLGGVLAAFAALAGVLLTLRAEGAVVGWGFQFQSPVFVGVTCFVLFAVGLNLSGVFEIGGRATGIGQGLAAREGWLGSFFTGLLAVVVAAPCTAPFMGGAVAAALAAPAVTCLAIMLAMGLGLALPYLLVAEIPLVARLLPRPGRWMDILRQALAFPMYGAAAWLLWVLVIGSGVQALPAALAGLVLIGAAAWAYGLGASRIGRAAAILALLGALALLPSLGAAPPPADGAEAYSAGRVEALLRDGHPVFVNLTAAWCVTCLVNERVALDHPAVRAAFASGRVAYLKGDWTRGDTRVTALLQSFGREGVPLYLLYRPGTAAPEVLPQILTAHAVLAALGAG